MTALLFGEDGLRGPGAQASVLLPLPWFATLYAEAFSITPPDDLAGVSTFGGGARLTPDNLTYTAELEQFFELAESHSLLVGLNFATGRSVDCLTGAPCVPRRRRGAAQLSLRRRPLLQVEAGQRRPELRQLPVDHRVLRPHAGRRGAHRRGRLQRGGRADRPSLLPRRAVRSDRACRAGRASPGATAAPARSPSRPASSRGCASTRRSWAAPACQSTTVGFLQVEYSMGAHGAHPF